MAKQVVVRMLSVALILVCIAAVVCADVTPAISSSSVDCVVLAELDCPVNDKVELGQIILIPVLIDMTGVSPPDENLGSFTGTLGWDSSVLTYVSDSGLESGFTGMVNVGTNSLTFNGAKPAGQSGQFSVLTVTFEVTSSLDECFTTSLLDLEFSAMAAAFTFRDLLPCLTVSDCDFTICCGEVTAAVVCDGFPQGNAVVVPVVIDMSEAQAPNDKLGSFTGNICWDPNVLSYVSDSGLLSGFTGMVNPGADCLTFNGANPGGAGGEFPVIEVTFNVVEDPLYCETVSGLDLEFSAMAAAVTFRDLLPCLTVNDCVEVPVSCGLCGDVNDDELCNSTDGLVILSYDVGLEIPPAFLEKINAGCVNLNADGVTNSTDALIMLSYDVGLPVPFCVCECGCPCPGAPALKVVSVDGVRVRGKPSHLTPRQGERIAVPVEVEMSQTNAKLGSFSATLDWDPEVLRFVGYSGGITTGFVKPVVNADGISDGHLAFTNANVEGADGLVNILNVEFEVIGSEGSFSFLDLQFSALTAAHTFNDLHPGLKVEGGKVEVVGLLATFALDQNYPNPFNPATHIRFTLPDARRKTQDARHTTLKIYNILGQEVRILVDEQKEPGSYTVVWDGRDSRGMEVPSGVYIYRLEAGSFVQSKRMLLVK